MKNKNIFKINIIYLVAIFLVATLFALGYFGIIQNDILSSFLIQIVVMFAIPLLLYSLLMKKNISTTIHDCGLKKISYKMILISILLGFVLYFINTFFANMSFGIITLLGYETLGTSTSSTFTYGTLFKELILSCVLPGFCEEFLHRGVMLHASKKHSNPRFCLIISSILFGLMHLNIRQFFYATILGFLIGYVSLVADSIIPAIIIHFMNNFLSNYFYYGTQFEWPLAKFVTYLTNLLSSNILTLVISSTISILLLFLLYNYLTKRMFKERIRKDVHAIVNALQMEKLSIIQAQIKFNEVNKLLNSRSTQEHKKQKFNFCENIFLISSFILGTLVTISSFMWGVI